MTSEQKVNLYLQYGQYGGNYYEESMSVQVNNRQLVYTKTLSLVTCIDLWGNKLTGEGLLVLDLSDNHLVGEIPNKIGNMQDMLSLDLSKNGFSGGISSRMTSMTYMVYLNLSNNFSGRIPITGQLSTFNALQYSGNPYLCGIPLDIKCAETKTDSIPNGNDYGDDDDDLFKDKCFDMSIGLGFAVRLLGLFAVILIRKPWSIAYFNFVDRILHKMVQAKMSVWSI